MIPIEEIRKIVSRFYEGKATQEEIRRAVGYFRTHTDVPDDLAVDRRLMLELDMEYVPDEASVPEWLTQSIEKVPGRSHYRAIIGWSAGVAASIAIVVAVGYIGVGSSHLDGAGVAEAVATDGAADSLTVEPQMEDDMTVKEEPMSRPSVEKSMPKARINKRKRIGTPERVSPSAKERRGAERSVEILNRSLAKVNLACARVEESFEQIDESLNNINHEE